MTIAKETLMCLLHQDVPRLSSERSIFEETKINAQFIDDQSSGYCDWEQIINEEAFYHKYIGYMKGAYHA
jgi:hypothetical protein